VEKSRTEKRSEGVGVAEGRVGDVVVVGGREREREMGVFVW
jgi:hypothetical protein